MAPMTTIASAWLPEDEPARTSVRTVNITINWPARRWRIRQSSIMFCMTLLVSVLPSKRENYAGAGQQQPTWSLESFLMIS